MKKLTLSLLSLLALSVNSYALELHSFNAVKSAVLSGQTLHIAVDLNRCEATSLAAVNQTTWAGIYTPNIVAVVFDRIVTSVQHFTLDNPAFPDKPVYEFGKYSMTTDGNVNLTIQVLDATSYKPLSDKITLDCKMGSGAHIFI